MHTRIGYLIPEFPGQTHIFFWREHQVLLELGVEVDWVSTRLPPRQLTTHIWASEAEAQTVYLTPLKLQDLPTIGRVMLQAGPKRWLQAIGTIFKSKDTAIAEKLRLLLMILISCKLADAGRQRGWSHLHVHSCGNAANLAMFASILGGLSYSLTLHGPLLETYGSNQEQKWSHAAFATVVSQKLLHEVQEKLQDSLPKEVIFAPMGVDIAKIQRRSPYLSWESPNSCRLFSCGRLNPIKGHQYLFKTLTILRSWGFDAYLEIAGEDDEGGTGYRKTLESLIQEMGLKDVVKLLGAIPEDSIRQRLEASHIFALASLNEGIPVAVMEAMAMELPVIVNDVGGNRELISTGVDGILLQPEQPALMAEAIAKILRNPDLALKLSQSSRQKIVEQFHHSRSAEVLAHSLEKVS